MIHGELKKVIGDVIFPFGQENIPKPYLKSTRQSLSPGQLMSFVVEVLFVSTLLALHWICHDVRMSFWPHKLQSQQPPVHSFA